MDPRERADEALARARARRAFVVTPDRATSPMDAQNTVQIPRSMVSGAQPPGRPGPAATVMLPHHPGRSPQSPQQPPNGQFPAGQPAPQHGQGPAATSGQSQVPQQQPQHGQFPPGQSMSSPATQTHPGLSVPGQPPQGPGQSQQQLPGPGPHAPGMPPHAQNGHPAGPRPGQQSTSQFPAPGPQFGGSMPGQHFGPGQPDQPTLPPPRPER